VVTLKAVFEAKELRNFKRDGKKLVIGTVGKTYYFQFDSENVSQEWHQAFEKRSLKQ
jgi:hypothetical protein